MSEQSRSDRLQQVKQFITLAMHLGPSILFLSVVRGNGNKVVSDSFSDSRQRTNQIRDDWTVHAAVDGMGAEIVTSEAHQTPQGFETKLDTVKKIPLKVNKTYTLPSGETITGA